MLFRTCTEKDFSIKPDWFVCYDKLGNGCRVAASKHSETYPFVNKTTTLLLLLVVMAYIHKTTTLLLLLVVMAYIVNNVHACSITVHDCQEYH